MLFMVHALCCGQRLALQVGRDMMMLKVGRIAEWCRCPQFTWKQIENGPPFLTAHDVKEWVPARR